MAPHSWRLAMGHIVLVLLLRVDTRQDKLSAWTNSQLIKPTVICFCLAASALLTIQCALADEAAGVRSVAAISARLRTDTTCKHIQHPSSPLQKARLKTMKIPCHHLMTTSKLVPSSMSETLLADSRQHLFKFLTGLPASGIRTYRLSITCTTTKAAHRHLWNA